jgi:hypothetical protein
MTAEFFVDTNVFFYAASKAVNDLRRKTQLRAARSRRFLGGWTLEQGSQHAH